MRSSGPSACGRLLIRSGGGGTLPIVAALRGQGRSHHHLRVLQLPDANIHAPNENMPAEYIPLGIETAKAMFQELGKL